MMDYTSKKKPLLVLFMFSCLLLPQLTSSVPLSRSLSLRNHQLSDSDPGLEVPVQVFHKKGVAGAEARNLGKVAARMDIEVNDYPGSGANNRHEPKSPGRA